MAKSPLILAALAKAAAPSIDLVQAHPLNGAQTGLFDSALLKGANGQDYVVRTPASTAGSLELDIETQVLRLLSPESRARLPFKVTTILGETRDSKRNRVVVFEYLYGQPIRFERVTPGGTLSNSLGAAIAAIHSLDPEVFRSAGLPEFSPAETARRLMNELDAVSALGLVPPVLLQRWEAALEDVALFRYQPTVVHGELSTETVLQSDDEVYSVLNWGALHIGDPAEDLAWIAAASVPDLLEAVRLTYFSTIGSVDATIAQRATLYGELTHARWLLHGKNINDQEIIDEAVASLQLIATEVTEGATVALSSAPIMAASAVAGGFLAEADSPEQEDTATAQIPLIEQSEDAADSDYESQVADEAFTFDSEELAPAFDSDVAPSAEDEVEAAAPSEISEDTDDRTKEIELPEKTDNELF
jgi:aminoglycoside phosphotransferase (APT) family kinase protein